VSIRASSVQSVEVFSRQTLFAFVSSTYLVSSPLGTEIPRKLLKTNQIELRSFWPITLRELVF